ncbi:MAG: hypothetical protein R3E65_01615 [Steroidobacteraceae bacterium]
MTPAQTYEAPRTVADVPATPSNQRRTEAPQAACRIVSPLADEVFLNVPSITVTAMGPPRGTPRLLLNGASIASPDGKPSFTVTPIPRGTYTAVVVFDGGLNTPLARTEPRRVPRAAALDHPSGRAEAKGLIARRNADRTAAGRTCVEDCDGG